MASEEISDYGWMVGITGSVKGCPSSASNA